MCLYRILYAMYCLWNNAIWWFKINCSTSIHKFEKLTISNSVQISGMIPSISDEDREAANRLFLLFSLNQIIPSSPNFH